MTIHAFTGLFRTVSATALTATLVLAAPAFAQDVAADAAADEAVATAQPDPGDGPIDPRVEIILLRRQMADMAQQMADLKAAMSSGLRDVRATQAAQPQVKIDNGRPQIASADGKFTANLHGVMQLDAASYDQGDIPAAQTDARARDLNAGTNFRRARIGIDGKAFGSFNYNVLFDFGGAGAEDTGKIQELWLEYAGWKPLRIRAGAFAPNLGLADAASTNGMLFLERPAAAEIARTLAGGDRRVGLQIAGNGDNWLLAGAVTGNTLSSLNSAASGFASQNYDEQLGFTARAAFSPIHNENLRIHVGANASFVSEPADAGPTATVPQVVQLRDRPELTVDSTRLIDTGSIGADSANHWALEFAAQSKGLLFEAEYFDLGIKRSDDLLPDPDFQGWYAQASFVLTGEARRYNANNAAFDAPQPAKPFDGKGGGFGAFEVALRYSTVDLNYNAGAAGTLPVAGAVRGGEQTVWTAGLNWYPNAFTKMMFDFQNVDVERLNSTGLEIGQDYQAYSVRTQFEF